MKPTIEGRPFDMLLVEDNPGEVRPAKEAPRDGKMPHSLKVVKDGEKVRAFLCRQGQFSKVRRPDIILLDLNLPKKDGREVLSEIKQDPELRRIPVVVLTTSKAEDDILKSYDLNANCDITKPVDLDQFFNVVQATEDFWLTIAKLPSNQAI